MASSSTSPVSSEKEYLFRCHCQDMHFLAVSWWPDDWNYDLDLDVGGWLSLEGNFFARFPARLKMAWKVLWKGHADTNVGVVLNRDSAQQIVTALQNYMADAAAAERKRND